MKLKIIEDIIYFYDESDVEIMYISFSFDECIWYFNSSDIHEINCDNVMYYSLLEDFMKQEYVFDNEIPKNYKDNNKLIWYSDCYYNPDDEWSIARVSSFNIEFKNECFYIWCNKELDKKIKRPIKYHCISFSPCGNGRYSKNKKSGLTLQDDFVTMIYRKLLTYKEKGKILKK